MYKKKGKKKGEKEKEPTERWEFFFFLKEKLCYGTTFGHIMTVGSKVIGP